MGTLVEKEIFLHNQLQDKSNDRGETLKYFWLVKNMLDFENIGFSRTVDSSFKYLTCADCEIPILGKQFLSDDEKDNFYLSHSRVTTE